MADKSDRHFLLDDLLPEPHTLLEPYARVEAFHQSAAFIFDTSCLLTPFEVSSSGLTDLSKILKSLAAAKRLYVPERVVREFVRRRSDKMKDIYKKLTELPPLSVPTVPGVRMFEGHPEYAELTAAAKQIEDSAAVYHRNIAAMAEKIRGWAGDDPVTKLYAEVFSTDRILRVVASERATISEDFEKRKLGRFAPGHKDADKPDGGIGDFLVWQAVLEQGKKTDVILVTNERKDDWAVSVERNEGAKEFLYPRFELIEQFRRTTGHKFGIVNLGRFLELHHARSTTVIEVEQAVRDEVSPLPAETSVPTLRSSGEFWKVLRRLHKVIGDHINSAEISDEITYPGLYRDIQAVCDSWVVAIGHGPNWEEVVAILRRLDTILKRIADNNASVRNRKTREPQLAQAFANSLFVHCSDFIREFYLLERATTAAKADAF